MNEGKNFLNGKYLYLLHSIQNSFKKFKKFGFESDPYRGSLTTWQYLAALLCSTGLGICEVLIIMCMAVHSLDRLL